MAYSIGMGSAEGYGKIERGSTKLKMETLEKIAGILEIELDDLVSIDLTKKISKAVNDINGNINANTEDPEKTNNSESVEKMFSVLKLDFDTLRDKFTAILRFINRDKT